MDVSTIELIQEEDMVKLIQLVEQDRIMSEHLENSTRKYRRGEGKGQMHDRTEEVW